jgi:hypothetical protein
MQGGGLIFPEIRSHAYSRFAIPDLLLPPCISCIFFKSFAQIVKIRIFLTWIHISYMGPDPWIRNSGQRIRKSEFRIPYTETLRGVCALDRLSLFTFSYFGRLAPRSTRSSRRWRCVRVGIPTWPAIWANCSLHVICCVMCANIFLHMETLLIFNLFI